jgi:L-fuculose-phosphate aldolase
MPKCLMVAREIGQLEREHELRRQICKTGRKMYANGFVAACEGNLSIRLDRDRILVTPAGACKGHLAPGDLLITDLSGVVLYGNRRPSTEMLMHLLFYRLRPDVRAVCHAHPPTATGFAAAGRALEEAVLPEVIVGLGKIPLAPYGTPGTWELCAGLEPLATKFDAILLENHGVVTCGQDLTTAYQRLETVEQFAKILLTAVSLGGPRLLPHAEVQKLIAARSRYGVSSLEGTADLQLSSETLEDQARQEAKPQPLLGGPGARPHADKETPRHTYV